MSHPLTMEDIMKMFDNTNRLLDKSRADWESRSLEIQKKMQENKEENDRRMQASRDELDKTMQETNRILQKTSQQVDKTTLQVDKTTLQVDKTSEEVQRTSQELKETQRVVKEVSRQIGQLGSRWGEFVEGLVAPACDTLFDDRNIPIHHVSQRVKGKLPGNRHFEIDLLAVNSDVIIPIEVKSRLRSEDVRDFIKRLALIKEFLPVYADKKVIGAVAGIVIEEGVDQFAINEGLFVIVQSGDCVKLANDTTFVPRHW